MFKKLVKLSLAIAMFGTFLQGASTFTLKLQSADPSGSINFKLQEKWAKTVATMTNSDINIEVLPVNSIVKYTETLDAIGAGVLDGEISSIAYFSGKDPAFALMGNTVGAWSDPNDLILFMEYGGGNEFMNKLMNPYGVTFVSAMTNGLESLVAKKPIRSVAELKGLKMRAPEGLVQAVFKAAGAAPVNLPYSEVFTSLDKGVIEAADASTLAVNAQAGLNKIAKFPIFPGFHSIPLMDLSINTKTWNKMPKNYQEIIKVSFRDYVRQIISTIKLSDKAEAARATETKDYTIVTWPESEKIKFRRIAQGEWEKMSTQSPNAKEAYDLITKFLKDNGMI
ncbi:TRAP transporter substrate-binding protein [Arcobacter sp. F2176]|uniref:TRAP transporter substrate-binding protein n=1 Tax=unclassified Arcobacter TaxID=2593671 RepID=UPI00100ACEC8|nr:TRAP transporter substrate-binding protein [Arcobacter sp. F2176]RXJ81613.1 C4-dicarboxylate ABC transporter substrate-binding protein [Arcobacter sp. F2176]|eukprot:TRINITY_DN1831_c1_g2_i2.p1 TRINITY_DN1831_c1_g2~~TRINITY_DN1831_c1_g2_i2.p1  ORF type:complete len:338 (-),score=-28.95 TRINITY_DN1831_c1_g2_i2:456-1469(-)